MKISVIVPTWKRPDYLAMTLAGLAGQTRPADEVIVGVRRDDEETIQYLDGCGDKIPMVRRSYVAVAGVVQSMQAAAELATGEIICFFDDDAEPMLDVLERMEAHFIERPRLGALGGRDLLQYLSEEEQNASLSKKVGILTWSGKTIGNHHCGKGDYRPVDVVKGCNCAFRADVLKKVGIEQGLHGHGAQSSWEWALCLDIKAQGFEVGYDPRIQVKHYVAPRHDNDQNHRGGFSETGIYNLAYNMAFVMRTRISGLQRFGFEVRSAFWGSRIVPGFAQWLRHLIQRNPHSYKRWRAARHGRRDGKRMARVALPKTSANLPECSTLHN